MFLIKKFRTGVDNKEEALLKNILHDDYKFPLHPSGKILNLWDI